MNEEADVQRQSDIRNAIERIVKSQQGISESIEHAESIMDRVCLRNPEAELKTAAKDIPAQHLTGVIQEIAVFSERLLSKISALNKRMDKTF